jgi:TolB-like protein/Flp pilus assembly protein TadD
VGAAKTELDGRQLAAKNPSLALLNRSTQTRHRSLTTRALVANSSDIRVYEGHYRRTRVMEESGESENLHGRAGDAEAPGPQRPVFISYASHEAAVAQKVCSALEAAGFPCWIAPRNVVPGTLYAEGIVIALDESRIVVLILSEQAVASAHVGREVERAASKRHPIIALKVDSASLTRAFEYFLNQSQWIEVSAGGIDAAIAKLVEAVGRHLSQATAPAHASSAPPRKVAVSRRVWGIAGAFVVLALVAAYFLADKAWVSKQTTASHDAPATTAVVSDKSIAVLPFVDMSEKKDQEYFADGMAEEILDLLAKNASLKVIGRTSSFQFKGKNEDIRKIGAELGVAYVLEGSVRRSGDRVRVTAQLISTDTGAHQWSETYDHPIGDVLKMEDEIAGSLVRALQIAVAADRLQSRPTLGNSEAYDLYLRGRYAQDRQDKESLEEAARYFLQALSLDPTFADASAMLALVYYLQGEFALVAPGVAFEKARHAADVTLQLDRNSAMAHAILGAVHTAYDWDWADADKESRQALALAPNDEFVLWFAARLSMVIGHLDDALTQMNAGVARNPVNPFLYQLLDFIQARRGHLREAEAAARRALEIDPTYVSAHYYLGIVLLAQGQGKAGLTEIQKEAPEGGQLAGLAMAYHALGRKPESDAALARIVREQADLLAFEIAEAYAFRGDVDSAFHWLERAYAQKDSGLIYIKGDLPLRKLEGDPRYKVFLEKMNLPE